VKRSTEDDIGTPVKNGDFGDHLSQQQKSKNDKISFTFFAKNGSRKIFCKYDTTSLIIISQSFDAMSQSVLIASDIFTVIKVDHFG
jgi:hypothetical protein